MKEKLLLTFALLLTAVTGAWAVDSESCGEGVTYTYVESTHTLTISGTGAMTDYNYPSEQPWYSYATEIETVIIKDGVTGIGNCAFLNCTGLTTVTIGTGVTYIGIDAFYNCTNVTDVYCNADPEKLTWDESNCDDFKPDGTTIIHVADAAPWYTKFGCKVNGTFIDKPYVSLIWNYDAATKTLTFSGTVIPSYDDLDECPWKDYVAEVENIVINEGVRGIGNYAFDHYESLTTVTIPASVTTIGHYAFQGCESLTTVTIPASVTSIGMFAFYDCYSLTTVTIGTGVTYIGIDAFYNCTNVEVVYCNADPEKLEWEEDGCNDFKQDGSTIIQVANAAPWIENFTDVVNGTFSDKPYVPFSWNYDADTKTLTFRGTVIPSYEGLEERPWEDYVEVVENIVIEDDVTSIGNHAFEGCESLTTVTIPASVTTIGDKAFWDCSSLATVTVYTPSCTLGDGAFNECGNLANIYVFSDLVDDYKGATNWSTYKDIITEMPNPNGKCGENVRWVLTGESSNYTLTITGTGAMADYASTSKQPWKDDRSSIKTVVIGAGVTSIGKNAFRLCSNLATVTFAEGSQLTSIGNIAFANTGLTSIEIPANVTSISNGAFINCSNLEAITVEAGNAVYDSRDNCNAIIEKSSNTLIAGCKNTTIPDDVTSIGDYAFNSCTGLTSIEIPASVTSIGEYAFKSCTGLTSIEIPAGVTSIGVSVFEGCSGLTSIEIPAGVTSIGVSAFYGCTGLTSIEIPTSVTTIGNSALKNCSNLATVTVYAPSCTLGNDSFVGCTSLTNIYVLSNYVGTYKCKNNWKDYADKISVMFDGTSTTTMNIPEDVEVNSVLYNRTFTEGKPSTVMLPFSLSSGQTLTGGTLYKFSGVTKNETTGKWEATMTETATLQANTPYLLLPDENLTDGKVTFNLNNSTVTLNTTDGGGKETADQGSHWTFKGTYEYMKWTTDTSDPDYNAERKAEIGRAYGFAGVAKTGIEVGDFVKVASGAKIRPMGCYLLWNDEPNASRAAARGAATEELPQSITVRLVSADGEVTGIGEIDTKTGEMTFDSEAWYTLNGVRLSGKPTKKGLYINNGKKVVIK